MIFSDWNDDLFLCHLMPVKVFVLSMLNSENRFQIQKIYLKVINIAFENLTFLIYWHKKKLIINQQDCPRTVCHTLHNFS